MGKYRILEGKDMDKLREECNIIWPNIQTAVYKCFGKLATIAWGKLQNDEYLMNNYIKTFNINEDQRLLKTWSDLIPFKDDISFLQFAKKHKHYINIHLLKSFDMFDINHWIESGEQAVITLLGDKGTGKTTFIAYLLKNLPNNIIILSDNLGHIENTQEVDPEIYLSLTKQIDEKVIEVGDENNLDDNQRINEIFKNELRSIDAIINPNDKEYKKAEKERRRSEFIIKKRRKSEIFSRKCLKYLRYGIDFLKSYNKKICIIFDDIDRLRNLKSAEKICREAYEISEALNVPVVISIREITERKMKDKDGISNRYHIIPPTFKSIVNARFNTFKQLLIKNPPKKISTLQREYTVEDCINFVKTIIESIIAKQENMFMFYMLSNLSIDLMLDYLKTLLASPHFDQEELKEIISGNKISQQKILETLLLYVYRDLNRDNTFLLNLYSCGGKVLTKSLDNLFAIRVLQIIREYGEFQDYRKSISYGSIINQLLKMGYENLIRFFFEELMINFVNFSIVETSVFNNKYEEKTQIYLLDSAYFYIDYLIYTYRYMETVIPDTYLDYEANFITLKKDLKEIDVEIEKFIKFIQRCEKEESRNVKDDDVLKKLNSRGKISENMRIGYERDKKAQMESLL